MSGLRLSSPKVVAEIIDREAIILDLRGGSYYATDGLGAVAWTAAVHGWTEEKIVSSAVEFYADQPSAGSEVSAMLDGFVSAGLLERFDDDSADEREAIEWPLTYETPVLEKHDDLQGMMQLDPIHDTDESGWPMPAPNQQ